MRKSGNRLKHINSRYLYLKALASDFRRLYALAPKVGNDLVTGLATQLKRREEN